MQNSRLAARYAKSLIDLALEQGKLDTVYGDMQSVSNVCKENPDFVALMKSPIVNADKKNTVIAAVFQQQVDSLSFAFLTLIVQKGREFFVPEIATSFITLYKEYNKINEVTLTTAHPIDESLRTEILQRIQSQFTGMTVDLITKVDESLIGGFTVESNNRLFDASIQRDLKDIKKQFLQNLYIADLH